MRTADHTKDKILDKWNIKKKVIESKTSRKTIKERDVLFISIGENIGFEQNGKGEDFLRPVLVCKKFSSNVFIGIPLTSKSKEGKFYAEFFLRNKKSTAILSQLRLFDTKRISYQYGRVSEGKFKAIKEKLIELLQ